eukprot:GHVT01042330.1.p1 GENE.GHVT01042330.1~~GHVT01042330.1.p1  ORF type:complete len:289 (+),score=4.14 GHVT01042330.1:343-1209(+)
MASAVCIPPPPRQVEHLLTKFSCWTLQQRGVHQFDNRKSWMKWVWPTADPRFGRNRRTRCQHIPSWSDPSNLGQRPARRKYPYFSRRFNPPVKLIAPVRWPSKRISADCEDTAAHIPWIVLYYSLDNAEACRLLRRELRPALPTTRIEIQGVAGSNTLSVAPQSLIEAGPKRELSDENNIESWVAALAQHIVRTASKRSSDTRLFYPGRDTSINSATRTNEFDALQSYETHHDVSSLEALAIYQGRQRRQLLRSVPCGKPADIQTDRDNPLLQQNPWWKLYHFHWNQW